MDYATGLAWQLAGGDTAGYSGDGGAANAALLSGIGGVVLDGAGDIYVADTGNGVIRQITNTAAVLNFADTNIGSSSALMRAGVINGGNQPLQMQSDALSTSNFVIDSDTCGGGPTLAPGLGCGTELHFAPQSAGPLTDALVFTDNSLNLAGSTQQMALSGNGLAQPQAQSINFPNSGPQSYGYSMMLAATASSGLTVSFTASGPGASGQAPRCNAELHQRRRLHGDRDAARQQLLPGGLSGGG